MMMMTGRLPPLAGGTEVALTANIAAHGCMCVSFSCVCSLSFFLVASVTLSTHNDKVIGRNDKVIGRKTRS